MILVWKDNIGTAKPLRMTSDFPNTKDQMTRYVDRMWIEKGKSAYSRLLITHDLDPHLLFEDQSLQLWLDDANLSLAIERVQAMQTGCAGHLLGYHSTACSVENLADAIEQQPAMKGIRIEVRAEFIVLGDPKNCKGKESYTKKILKIYAAWTQVGNFRHALVQIYSS